MFFNPRTLLLGAVALMSAGFASADVCESGPWEDVSSVGGSDGDRFCATYYGDGVVITGVEVWATSQSVRGVQFYYSNGKDSGLVGDSTNDGDGQYHTRLDWDSTSDLIDQVKMWGNGDGKWLGRFYLHTKAGKEIDVGKDTNGQTTYETNVGSGVLLGAFGASKDDGDKGKRIVNMGLLFLKSTITKISQDDVVFADTPDDLNARMQGLETTVLDYADHTNSQTDSNETFTFTKSITETTSKSYTNTATNQFGIKISTEISGEIMGIGAKDTYELSYQYTNTKSEEDSTSSAVSLTYSVATALKPGQRVFCRATAMSGKYSGSYTCTVNVWLADGDKYSFKGSGTMDQIQWSKADSVCQDTDFDPVSKRDIVHTKRATKFIS